MEFTKTYKQEKGAEHFCGGKKRHCQANVNTNTQMINNTDIQHTYSMVAEANNNKTFENTVSINLEYNLKLLENGQRPLFIVMRFKGTSTYTHTQLNKNAFHQWLVTVNCGVPLPSFVSIGTKETTIIINRMLSVL